MVVACRVEIGRCFRCRKMQVCLLLMLSQRHTVANTWNVIDESGAQAGNTNIKTLNST